MQYTKYEKARMIGSRALQLSMGAPFLLKLNEDALQAIGYSPIKIAMREFDEGILPITVKRPKSARAA
ncbi:MAG: DNA-directed RNA polymerase subunit K [Nanoarchaeota archaeon]|nr:DNA-directed RNA polymerase subunit K [Nanoarchaeota archaeon]